MLMEIFTNQHGKSDKKFVSHSKAPSGWQLPYFRAIEFRDYLHCRYAKGLSDENVVFTTTSPNTHERGLGNNLLNRPVLRFRTSRRKGKN
jgi:hypothetical protein